MTERMDVLSSRINALLREHRTAKVEIQRLTKALQKAEAARDNAARELENARRGALRDTLAALPIADDAKPTLRRSLDAVIAEIDSILMQLHD